MKRVSMVLACAAMLFAVQPAVASDDDVSSQLAKMQELVNGLQQKVDAQQEQLSQQGELLKQAQEVVRERQDKGTESGISSFLDQVSVGGHLAGSYFYNFNTPNTPLGGAGINSGNVGLYPFHPDHNSFTVDQVWFSIGKPATEESRAGFQFDVLFGNDANFLGQGTGSAHFFGFNGADRLEFIGDYGVNAGRRYTAFDSASDYYIAQAYVEYQCGCLGPEIDFVFGKRQTDVGAEVVQSGQNFNITLGNVYQLLQPVDHLGLWATTHLGDIAELTLGIMNDGGSAISSPDLNSEKSYEASLLLGNDKMNVRTTFIYGANQFDSAAFNPSVHANALKSGLFDVTAWFNPTDKLSTWANYTLDYVEGSRAMAHGLALAGRLQVTDKVGAAVRGEYVRIRGTSDGTVGGVSGMLSSPFTYLRPDDPGSGEIYSLTGTIDYALTEHLTARAEIRYDTVRASGARHYAFLKNGDNWSNDQTVGGAEVVYNF